MAFKFDTAIVLAGGKGTRLRSVLNDLPKPMAPVQGRPFLAYVLDYLEAQDIRHAILSVGYKADAIRNHFGDQYKRIKLSYAYEEEPLGTGGGILHAAESLPPEMPFYVLNGDSLFLAELVKLKQYYETQSADLVMALKRMQHFDRYGLVEVDEQHRIQAFREKQFCTDGLINAGTYLLNKAVLDAHCPAKGFSFEQEFLEKELHSLRFFGLPAEGYFIDIGIPQDYAKAQRELREKIGKYVKGSFSSTYDKSWTLFLDRDGVINRRIPGNYVRLWSEFEWLPGSCAAIARLSRLFGTTVVVTNQQGVGKNLLKRQALESIHQRMQLAVAEQGGAIHQVYYCPELAIENPACRKPNTGMALQAQTEFPHINFSRSVMVGDSVSDIEFGQTLGMHTVWIKGKEEEAAAIAALRPNRQFGSLAEFARDVCGDT